MRTTPQDTVRCRFFAPVESALLAASSTRSCPEFPDEEHIECGIGRVIAHAQSGRDWVQKLRMWMNSGLMVSTFFKSLKSTRRLTLLEEVDAHVRAELDVSTQALHDPLSGHEELRGFALYASDGHYEEADAHAVRIGKKVEAAGYFYSLNLRSHSMALLDVARPKRKREHDMSALKRLSATDLRLGEPKGVKVMHVYDPAGIDYAQWRQWKARGIYFLSREKENSKAEVVGLNDWDRGDLRNTGILSDELVGVFCGLMLRRVRYRDPATGTVYSYMTNEMTLPPGLIAFLYKLRWDIEKVFDEKKNKLLEQKSWAKGLVAHSQQAHFVCLAHNLMVLFERCLESDEGIRDTKVERKREKRAELVAALARERGEILNPMVQQCRRSTQRSLQSIRWLRRCLCQPTSWREEVDLLRPLMEHYLR
jgi:hypothetical protein